MGGLLVALQGQLIHLLAGHVVLLRHVLGGLAVGDVLGGVVLQQPGVHVPAAVQGHGQGGHGLDAAGHHAVGLAGLDLPRRQGHGLEGGGAEPVHGEAAGGVGQAGPGGHQAGGVEALLLLRDGAAQDHVLHQGGIQLGELLHNPLEHQAAHIDGVHVAQGALLTGLGDGGAAVGHHYRSVQRFCHFNLPPFPLNQVR